jgi:CubicO group peptidase (beta-lactamase class C family)
MHVEPVLTPRQQQAEQRRGKRRRTIIITASLVVAGVVPVLAYVLAGWSARHAAPVVQPSAPSIHQTTSTAVVQPTVSPHAMQPVVSNPANTRITAQVDALFNNLVTQQKFSGSVLIAKDGQILLDKGYSMANWDQHIPNNPLSRFYLGSVTKEFTATAILLLQQRGKLDVHKSICVYVNPCPPPWQPVTIHEVLTHTSGIPELDTSQLSGASPEAWIASYDNVPLAFTPGSMFDYCSVCYQILGYVVQSVSGEPYSQFMQQNIFDPLHMAETGFDATFFYSQSIDANGYNTWQSSAEQLGWQMSPNWSFLFGSGLLYSSVGDLYRWDRALYTNVLLSQASRDAAFTSYTQNSLFAGSTYGYGWFIAKSPVPGHRLIWHDGVIDGFRTYIGRYIDDNVTVIFLSNLATVDSPTLAQSIQKIVFGQ